MKHLSISSCLIVAAQLSSLDVHAAPADPSGIDKLLVYEGTWKVSTQYFNTPFTRAAQVASKISNDCWKHVEFVVCAQTVNDVHQGLTVYSYDEKARAYKIYNIGLHGEDAPASDLLIDGDTWTFPWKNSAKGKVTYFRNVNQFRSATTIEYRIEYSPDNTHWVIAAKGVETKSSPRIVIKLLPDLTSKPSL